jgi:hypothetical protein
MFPNERIFALKLAELARNDPRQRFVGGGFGLAIEERRY